MKFRNPWIDPRVTNVRSADLIRYMHSNGWEEFRSERRRMRLFQRSRSDFAILVPMADKADDYIESIIEAITQLARAEDRYAGAVLDDILAGAATVTPGPVIGSLEPMTKPVAD